MADMKPDELHCCPRSTNQGSLRYFRVFAATMQREWFGIDRLRLDKFMMLARKFVRDLFSLLRGADWCARLRSGSRRTQTWRCSCLHDPRGALSARS